LSKYTLQCHNVTLSTCCVYVTFVRVTCGWLGPQNTIFGIIWAGFSQSRCHS